MHRQPPKPYFLAAFEYASLDSVESTSSLLPHNTRTSCTVGANCISFIFCPKHVHDLEPFSLGTTVDGPFVVMEDSRVDIRHSSTLDVCCLHVLLPSLSAPISGTSIYASTTSPRALLKEHRIYRGGRSLRLTQTLRHRWLALPSSAAMESAAYSRPAFEFHKW
jgi:hypothetical protein